MSASSTGRRVAENLPGWYESNLSTRERKRRGHFSTPSSLVEQILDACGYTSASDLSSLRVLDPACGSGNFLAGVTRRLLASGIQREQDSEVLVASVQRNVWGFDPDPVACFLAEMQLRTVLAEHMLNPNKQQFHIHQADGLAFPWNQHEAVDLFLANPPYLAAKNNDLSGYRCAQGRGQADSYLLFLELALQVVRPNGWIALVLPDPVLARINATKERQRLLEETTLHSLWHLSGVFAAYVGAVVIIAQKCPPHRLHVVSWVREKWTTTMNMDTIHRVGTSTVNYTGAMNCAPTSTIAQSLLRRQAGNELRYLLGNREHSSLVERLHTHLCDISASDAPHYLAPLSQFVTIRRGEELGKVSSLLTETCSTETREYHPVLRGGVDVHPYETPVGRCWIARESITKPLERYLAPKLLVVKSTGWLQATLDQQGHIVLQTLYLLNLRAEDVYTDGDGLDTLYFLLALLNSRLLREYVHVLHTAYKWVQPQMEQHVLACLPIPLGNVDEKEQIIERAKLLVDACSGVTPVVELKEHIQVLYEEQERAICALYEGAANRASTEMR